MYPNSHKEIGWFPIEKVEIATEKNIGIVTADTEIVFHWHGETFDLLQVSYILPEVKLAKIRHLFMVTG